MSNDYQRMQDKEKQGEREDWERRKLEREEEERRIRGAGSDLAASAQEYGHKISEAATQAKDYVSDKVSVVGDKIKELQNADLGEITENARDYARKNPGQAILISAAVGFVLGLLIRGRRS